MKIAFYAPLKPITHPIPSGDREIARSIFRYFASRSSELFVLSEFRTRWFYRSPLRWATWLRALYRAYRRARKERPDVYFTYHLYYKAPDPIGLILAWWFQRPYIIFDAIFDDRSAKRPGRWVGYWLTKLALRKAYRVFSENTQHYEFLAARYGKKKIVFLPPSVDLANFQQKREVRETTRERLGISPEEIVVVTVAMLRSENKNEGMKFLLQSLSELREEGFLFRWVHVGDGPSFDEIRQLSKLKLGARSQFLGAVEQNKIAEILQASDIFAFPGIHESFGLAFVEAQAAGLPVVAFENAGLPMAVEKDGSGFLTPALDPVAYKLALRSLLKDPILRKRMSDRARIFVREKFDAAKNYSIIWQAMDEAVKENSILHTAREI